MRTITLKSKRERQILNGHPWVFEGAIDRDDGHGDIAEVQSSRGDRLGYGLYSPFSSIRVRMIDFDLTSPSGIDEMIQTMIARRARMGLPSGSTTGYRLTNGEGDGIGGLVIDVFGGLITMQTTTLPLFNRSQELADAIGRAFPDASLFQVAAPSAVAEMEGLPQIENRWFTDRTDRVQFVENDVRYTIDTDTVQKTGHYADMRPHREFVASICEGKSLLDLYCYTGGFSLNANGAVRRVAIDSSTAAIDTLRENATTNGCEIDARVMKVESAMQELHDQAERFDIVVLDPPKLAPNKAAYDRAMKKKAHLVRDAARLLVPGGVLCIGSCSALIGPQEIERLLTRNTTRAKVIWRGGQAACHPYLAAMREGAYLSFVAAIVE